MCAKPSYDTQTRGATAGEAGREQIATRWRFPIQHFTGAKHAGHGFEHQVFVERLKDYTAGAADRLGQGSRTDEWYRQRLYRTCKLRRIGERVL